MSPPSPLPDLREAKARARRLRQDVAADGASLSHGAALEQVAKSLGFRDWNACSAVLSRQDSAATTPDPARPVGPLPLAVGDPVRGHYLRQPFTARVVRIETLAADRPNWVRLDLQLDEAVDVVRSTRFSNFRRRVVGVIGPDGISAERTSDGAPHLVIELPLQPGYPGCKGATSRSRRFRHRGRSHH